MTPSLVVFMVFGLGSQGLLAGFFAARRWAPTRADRLGRLAYAVAALGLVVGLGLALDGQSYRLFTGPLLMAAWAALGWTVDLWRPRPWRGPRVDWGVMAPYVILYFFGQMFLWWPLWDLARGAWTAFGVLFVVNTALNLRGHAEAGRQQHR
jgi:hypothetical protein